MHIEKKLEALGLTLPPPPPRGGLYKSCKLFGTNLAYVSGCGCSIDGPVAGKLGIDFTLEEGQEHAKNAMLNVLSVLKAEIGDLDRVKSCVKILVFVASADDFYDQPAVANGATKLLGELFGEEIGIPSRSAVGMNVLPGNLPVEIEAMFELCD